MKKILVSFLIAVIFLSAFSFVNAGSASISLTPSSTTIKKGDSFTIDVVASAGNNVTGITSNLIYDNSVISLEKSETSNGFYDLRNGNVLEAGIINLNGVTLSKTVKIFTLTFKVLDNAKIGNTEISITDIELAIVNDNKEQLEVNAIEESITIQIAEEGQTEPEKDTTAPVGKVTYKTNADGSVTATVTFEEENVTITNNDGKNTYVFTEKGEFTFIFKDAAGNEGTATAKVESIEGEEPPVNPDDSTADEDDEDKELPQTGIEDMNILSIVALAAIAITSFVLYKKYKDI